MGAGASSETEEDRAAWRAARKRRKAEKRAAKQGLDVFIVELTCPMGLKVGSSPFGTYIGNIDPGSAAEEWNMHCEENEFDRHRQISYGDLIVGISNGSSSSKFEDLSTLPHKRLLSVVRQNNHSHELLHVKLRRMDPKERALFEQLKAELDREDAANGKVHSPLAFHSDVPSSQPSPQNMEYVNRLRAQQDERQGARAGSGVNSGHGYNNNDSNSNNSSQNNNNNNNNNSHNHSNGSYGGYYGTKDSGGNNGFGSSNGFDNNYSNDNNDNDNNNTYGAAGRHTPTNGNFTANNNNNNKNNFGNGTMTHSNNSSNNNSRRGSFSYHNSNNNSRRGSLSNQSNHMDHTNNAVNGDGQDVGGGFESKQGNMNGSMNDSFMTNPNGRRQSHARSMSMHQGGSGTGTGTGHNNAFKKPHSASLDDSGAGVQRRGSFEAKAKSKHRKKASSISGSVSSKRRSSKAGKQGGKKSGALLGALETAAFDVAQSHKRYEDLAYDHQFGTSLKFPAGMSGSPLGLKIVGSPWGSLVVGVQSSGAAARYNKDQDSEKRKEKEAASASGSGSGDQDQDQDRNQNQDQDQESQDQGSHGQTALNIRPGDVILSMTDQSGRTTDVAAMSHTDVAKFVRMKLISVDRTFMRLGRVGLQEARRLSRWAMSSHYFDVEVEKPLGITFGQTQAGFFISHIEPRGNAQQQWNMRAAASASVFSASSSALSSRSSGGLAALGGLGSKRGSSLPALKGTGGLGKLPLGQHKHRASLSLSKNALGASQLSSSLSSAPDARLPRHHKLYCGLALVAIQEKENHTFIIEDDSMKKLHALIDTRTNERVILRFRHYSENELKRLRRWCTAAAIPSSSSAGGNDGGLGRIWDIFFRGPKASPSPSPTPSPHPSPSPSSSAQDTEDPNKDDFFGENFAPLDLENFDFRSKFYI